ncbi:DNA polymerase IV [Ferrithrix thermotolerans]|uniref:DNA polymerase IV n=1 Tax=Ferrithrix thermotolerans TaxID=209649 RepID=UPI0015BF94BA|nr:DNA polymerase IV [Ferrithrix thermotolerans]
MQSTKLTDVEQCRRVIAHVDIDCFFASAEVARDPSLIDRPVIVAGSSSRGVVLSPNYEARRFGVRSAMPVAKARALCPHAIYVVPDHAYYRELSKKFYDILRTLTPLVEMVSVDEAYLDLSGSRWRLGSPLSAASKVREAVFEEMALPVSVGIGTSKTVAKIGSQMAKPKPQRDRVIYGSGIFAVEPGHERAFLFALPVTYLPGVGPKSASRLASVGVTKVSDLFNVPRATLTSIFGRSTESILSYAEGNDPRSVEIDRERKSLGHERTFDRDVTAREDLVVELRDLCEEIAEGLSKMSIGGKTVSVKVKFSDFSVVSVSESYAEMVFSYRDILLRSTELLRKIDLKLPVRLLGVSLSNLRSIDAPKQLYLDRQEKDAEEMVRLQRVISEINQRYGRRSVHRASTRPRP